MLENGYSIFGSILVILIFITELIRRNWSKQEQKKKKEEEFQKNREKATKDGDFFNRYND